MLPEEGWTSPEAVRRRTRESYLPVGRLSRESTNEGIRAARLFLVLVLVLVVVVVVVVVVVIAVDVQREFLRFE